MFSKFSYILLQLLQYFISMTRQATYFTYFALVVVVVTFPTSIISRMCATERV